MLVKFVIWVDYFKFSIQFRTYDWTRASTQDGFPDHQTYLLFFKYRTAHLLYGWCILK